MTFKNAIKKLEKLGEVKNQGTFYFVRLENAGVNFIKQGDSAICFHVNYYDKNNENYHTSYYDNITQMINCLKSL